MIQFLSGLVLTCMASAPPSNALTASAVMTADKLEVGKEHTFTLTVETLKQWSSSKAGFPHPIVQLEVPASVELSGPHLTEDKDLARNEFLQHPFERLLKKSPEQIAFKLNQPPAENEALFINIIAYISDGSSGGSYFVRKRLKLPLAARVGSMEVEPEVSSFSGNSTLNIGDKAAGFKLPTADDKHVSLDDFLGKQNIIVTTYRAFW